MSAMIPSKRSFQWPMAALACIFLHAGIHAQTGTQYQKEIDDWHAARILGLQAADGWLNLVGLYWLEEGRNSFGSGPENRVVFPAGTIPATAGYFQRSGNRVTLVANGSTPITIGGQPVKESLVYVKDSLRSPLIASGSLRLTIIQRENKIGIRLRDLKSPQLAAFKGIERYPVDTAWRIPAVLQVPIVPQTIAITNVLGQTSRQQSPGRLVFTVNEKTYTLDALEEEGELFIIFGDETSGKTTYPSGRFLKAALPGKDGTTTIDFNKAYNPPCAFTAFATCPLPPRQNILPIAVSAGEKNTGHH